MAASSSSSHVGSSSSSPCAACKFLRRKCTSECVFAPYFPPDQPQKFANVHKIFGASNVTKILTDLPVENRQDCVTSLAFEAEARMRDPVYGCVGAISSAQHRIAILKSEVELLIENIEKMKLKGIEVPTEESLGLAALPPGSVGLGGGGDQGPRATASGSELQLAGKFLGLQSQSFETDVFPPSSHAQSQLLVSRNGWHSKSGFVYSSSQRACIRK
ncbi:hypothetical protein R1sor_020821 [Riccia sorocarpa]|uniref:LOB domain-containing protein n=1 Tax=Riccia sorocarpa TaxID=122646 RepID=A0ABD3GFA4_9MARC